MVRLSKGRQLLSTVYPSTVSVQTFYPGKFKELEELDPFCTIYPCTVIVFKILIEHYQTPSFALSWAVLIHIEKY